MRFIKLFLVYVFHVRIPRKSAPARQVETARKQPTSGHTVVEMSKGSRSFDVPTLLFGKSVSSMNIGTPQITASDALGSILHRLVRPVPRPFSTRRAVTF